MVMLAGEQLNVGMDVMLLNVHAAVSNESVLVTLMTNITSAQRRQGGGAMNMMDFEPLVAIPEELRKLPTGDVINELPYEAPWMGPFGACLINVTALRYTEDGTIECQLGDEDGTPYDNGKHWINIAKFPNEWPQ